MNSIATRRIVKKLREELICGLLRMLFVDRLVIFAGYQRRQILRRGLEGRLLLPGLHGCNAQNGPSKGMGHQDLGFLVSCRFKEAIGFSLFEVNLLIGRILDSKAPEALIVNKGAADGCFAVELGCLFKGDRGQHSRLHRLRDHRKPSIRRRRFCRGEFARGEECRGLSGPHGGRRRRGAAVGNGMPTLGRSSGLQD
jgi:hypothetical protein